MALRTFWSYRVRSRPRRIISTGRPVMAMGGYTGMDPWPTVSGFKAIVAQGEVHYVLVGSALASLGFGGSVHIHISPATIRYFLNQIRKGGLHALGGFLGGGKSGPTAVDQWVQTHGKAVPSSAFGAAPAVPSTTCHPQTPGRDACRRTANEVEPLSTDMDDHSLAAQLREKRSEMMLSELEAVVLRLFEQDGFEQRSPSKRSHRPQGSRPGPSIGTFPPRKTCCSCGSNDAAKPSGPH